MTPTPEQAPSAPRIGVIIVVSGHGSQLPRCLDAIGAGLGTIVVDNGSGDSDGLELTYPGAQFIRLPRNFGLTKALNIGIRAASAAEMVLFLSPEVEITASAVESLADTLEKEPGVGAVCPLLLNPDGSGAAQISALPSPAQPYPEARAAEPGKHAMCVTGKAIMFRAFFLRALRHIDERYGDYGSSFELCQQVRRANKTILIHPTETAVLREGTTLLSGSQEADREVGTYHFLAKHSGFGAGLSYLVKRVFGALFSFRFGRAVALLTLKKIDGG